MAQILVTKPGTLTLGDRRKLRRAGVVTVEAEAPQDVRMLTPEGPPLGGDDLLYAAMRALAQTSDDSAARYAKRAFVEIIAKLLAEQRTERLAE